MRHRVVVGLLATTGMPLGRTRHTGIYDDVFERFLVFGGDTNGSSTNGGQTDSLWGLPFAPVTLADTIKWVGVGQDSVPPPRSGHVAVYHTGPIFAHIPERFTPSSSSPPGSWQPLTAGTKYQPYYPHTFLTSSGKLFWAGNDGQSNGTSWKFDPASYAWTDTSHSGFSGSCSVMYLPDSVLKTGLSEDVQGKKARIAIVPASGKANWFAKSISEMKEERAYHNLTMLPTGEVLLTGGLTSDVPQHVPYLWNPSGAVWSDSLAPNPADRWYHSTAILLPDARVLTAGGPPSDAGATVFWPPYLFNDDSSFATRPQINGLTLSCTDGLEYDVRSSIVCDSASLIRSVCLVKPSSVTHQLNMDQRYVPLVFSYVSSSAITVTGPKSANHAPPGDYLLFLVKSTLANSDRVPSVARWVRLGPDLIRPGPTTDLGQDLVTTTTVRLVWTSAGDDSMSCRASGYSLRHALKSITDANFDSLGQGGAPQVTWADSAGAGVYPYDEKLAIVTGLTPCTRYYFALKTRDDVFLSSLSNVAAIQTACGGGGGGMMASSGGPGGLRPRNIMLAGAGGLGGGVDLLSLGAAESGGDSTSRVSLMVPYEVRVILGQVRALAVDHPPGTRSVVVGGNIVTGTVSEPASIRLNGQDIASELRQGKRGGVAVSGSDTLVIAAPGVGANGKSLLLEVSYRAGADPASAGVIIQSFDPQAGWSVGRFYRTRPVRDVVAVDSLAGDSVRAVCAGDHALRSVSIVTPLATQPQPIELGLTDAGHSRLGVVRTALSLGGTGVTLEPGEDLALTFIGPPPASGAGRELFLSARGSWTALTATAPIRSVVEGAGLPRAFALYPPRPNPSRNATSIRFDMPRAREVSIDIFDVQGRKVETLARGVRLPGSYAIEWRHRGAEGAGVSPGVYLCRMVAGGFSSRRKIVVLP